MTFRHAQAHQSNRTAYRCFSLLVVRLTAYWMRSRSAPSRAIAVIAQSLPAGQLRRGRRTLRRGSCGFRAAR